MDTALRSSIDLFGSLWKVCVYSFSNLNTYIAVHIPVQHYMQLVVCSSRDVARHRVIDTWKTCMSYLYVQPGILSLDIFISKLFVSLL